MFGFFIFTEFKAVDITFLSYTKYTKHDISHQISGFYMLYLVFVRLLV